MLELQTNYVIRQQMLNNFRPLNQANYNVCFCNCGVNIIFKLQMVMIS